MATEGNGVGALPTFLTARQVADMLQVDERTIPAGRSTTPRCQRRASVASCGSNASHCCGGLPASSHGPRVYWLGLRGKARGVPHSRLSAAVLSSTYGRAAPAYRNQYSFMRGSDIVPNGGMRGSPSQGGQGGG